MKTKTASFSLRKDTIAYLDWVKSQIPFNLSRSQLLDAIIRQDIDISDYPPPREVKKDLDKIIAEGE